MGGRRVLVIGWDGACWPVLEKYLEAGRLPTLKKLVQGGAAGDLVSTVPFHSGPAWMSISTGVNPGKHNIFHFCRTSGYDMQFVNGSFRRSASVWEIIGQAGMKVAVVNIPMTFPPQEVNGVMVSGMDTPSAESRFTYPESLGDELTKSGYLITWGSANFRRGREEEFADKLLKMARKRGDLVLSLLRDPDPRFMIVNFAASDRAQHFFWHTVGVEGQDWLGEIYSELDSILSGILNAIDDSTTLLLVSDHGFGPLHKVVGLGEWLRDEGLLKLRSRVPRYMLRKMGESVERVGGRRGLDMTFNRVSKVRSALQTARIDAWSLDWSRTKAWFPPTEGGIRINVKGREPHGIVDGGREYEELREHIIHGLESLTDVNTGVRVIEKVHRREEIYSGPYVVNAPDLVIEPGAGYAVGKKSSPAGMNSSGGLPMSGDHLRTGVFVGYGLDMKAGTSIESASVYDIAPTVLHLLGLPVPGQMDGRVLKDAFEQSSEPAQREVTRRGGTDGEREKIRTRITRLQSRLVE